MICNFSLRGITIQNTMPAITTFRVLMEEKIRLAEDVGKFQFSIIEEILKLGNEIYYKAIGGAEDDILPIRIVPPEGGFKRAEKRAIEDGRPFNIFVSTLDEPSLESLIQGISEVTRMSSKFHVQDVPVRLILFSTIKSRPYKDMLSLPASDCFKITADMPVLFELAEKDRFPSLHKTLSKAEFLWEYFSAEHLPAGNIPPDSFEIKSYSLRGKEANIGGSQFFSISGTVEFCIKSSEENVVKKINALLHFLEFSGIGCLKRYGFGNVRVISR